MSTDPDPAALLSANRTASFAGGIALMFIAIAAFAWTPAVAPALAYLVVALCVWSCDRWLVAFAFLVSLAVFLIITMACAGAIAFAAGDWGVRALVAVAAVGLAVAAGCICLAVADTWSILRPRRPDVQRGFEVIVTPRPAPKPDVQPAEDLHG